jgi:hypothetical protein
VPSLCGDSDVGNHLAIMRTGFAAIRPGNSARYEGTARSSDTAASRPHLPPYRNIRPRPVMILRALALSRGAPRGCP